MQTIILASGRGTRLGDMTKDTPKPLLQVKGRNLLEHKLNELPAEIDEIILVIGYLGEQIQNYFGNDYQGRPVRYVWQTKLDGTAGAVRLCADIAGDRFLVMNGDDLYARADIENCLRHDQSLLVIERDGPFCGGRVVVDEKGKLTDIVEGSYQGKNLINTGLYVVRKEFFGYEPVKLAGKEEWGLPQTLALMASDYPVRVEKAGFWAQVNSQEDLARAQSAV